METLRYVVLVNGLLAVVSLAYYVLLQRETFFSANRLALWLGLAGAVILPVLELPDWRPQPVRTAMQRTAQVIVPRILPKTQDSPADVTITFPNQKTYQAFQIQPQRFIWSWQSVLIVLYIIGVFLLLIRFGIQLASLRKLIRQSIHDYYDGFTLAWNKNATSPFSFFGWVVVNPNQHTSDELEHILRHERVHVQNCHSLDMIGAELVCVLLWFNPAAYLFRHLVHQALEFIADRAVLAEGVDAKAYQYNLLKVSLSAGYSTITNHFSKSQLKLRIIMLNRQKSSKITWLKYPIFFIAALTVASAFAHPKHIQVLRKYVPKRVAETLTAVTKPANEPWQLTSEVEQAIKSKVAEPETSTNQQSKPDTVRVSLSRYITYQGNYLYWVITPKTSFDDLAIMKQEFARHGYKMQVQTLKYDPLNAYISDLKITIIRPVAGVSDFEETGMDGGPIQSYGGYNGLNTLKTVAAVGSYPFNDNFLHMPEGLVQIARNEELAVTKLIDNKKMDSLIAEGQRKYGHLGIGLARFDKKEIIKQSSPNSSVRVDPNGYLSVDNAVNFIKVFINNKPAAPEDIRLLKIDQLYTLAVIYGYASAKQKEQKQAETRYLLFYINGDN